jgi:hypothetical protein
MGIYDAGRQPIAEHNPQQQQEYAIRKAARDAGWNLLQMIEAAIAAVKELIKEVIDTLLGYIADPATMIADLGVWVSQIPFLSTVWQYLAPVLTGVAEALTLPEIAQFFYALRTFFDAVDFMDPDFDKTDALIAFVQFSLIPTGLLATLVGGFLPDINIGGIDASKIISGTIPQSMVALTAISAGLLVGVISPAQIPSLAASIITSGTFSPLRIPGLDASQIISGTFPQSLLDITAIPANIVSGVLDLATLPGLPASQITSGTFSALRVPDLDASKIISGQFPQSMVNITSISAGIVTGLLSAANIPGLDVSKITSGIFPVGVIPDLDASKIATGVFSILRIPGFDASKIISGIFSTSLIPDLSASKITSGVFSTPQIPAIDASKVNSGVFPSTMVSGVPQVITDVSSIITGAGETLAADAGAAIAAANTDINSMLTAAQQSTANAFGGFVSLINGLRASYVDQQYNALTGAAASGITPAQSAAQLAALQATVIATSSAVAALQTAFSSGGFSGIVGGDDFERVNATSLGTDWTTTYDVGTSADGYTAIADGHQAAWVKGAKTQRFANHRRALTTDYHTATSYQKISAIIGNSVPELGKYDGAGGNTYATRTRLKCRANDADTQYVFCDLLSWNRGGISGTDDFERTVANLGTNWSETYGGTDTAVHMIADGHAADFNQQTGGSRTATVRRIAAADYHTQSDYQKITHVNGHAPEAYSAGSSTVATTTNQTRIYARVNDAFTSYVFLQITGQWDFTGGTTFVWNKYMQFGYANGGAETLVGSPTLCNDDAGATWEVNAGDWNAGSPRKFTAYYNGSLVLTWNDTGAASAIGSTNRGWAFGKSMQNVGGFGYFSGRPSSIASITGADAFSPLTETAQFGYKNGGAEILVGSPVSLDVTYPQSSGATFTLYAGLYGFLRKFRLMRGTATVLEWDDTLTLLHSEGTSNLGWGWGQKATINAADNGQAAPASIASIAVADNSPSPGSFGLRPAPGTAGRLYPSYDVGRWDRDTGNTWECVEINDTPYGNLGTVPTTGWTLLNMGTATFVSDLDGMLLTAPSRGSASNAGYAYRAYPSGAFTLIVQMDADIAQTYGFPNANTWYHYGLAISDGTKYIAMGPAVYNPTSFTAPWYSLSKVVAGYKWTSAAAATTALATYFPSVQWIGTMPRWYRYRYDGTTTHYFEYSINGIDWHLLFSEPRTTFLTPTRIGLLHDNYSGVNLTARIRSWKGVA